MASMNARWSMVAAAFAVGTALGALSTATLKRRRDPWDRIDPADFSDPAGELLELPPDEQDGTGSGIADVIVTAGDRKLATEPSRVVP